MTTAAEGTLVRTQARRKVSVGKIVGKTGFYFLVAIILFYILFPFYWTIRTSFMLDNDIYATPVIYWPGTITFDHYTAAFTDPIFPKSILNSTIVGVSVTIIALAFGASGAYALGRFKFMGRAAALYLILAMSMFPGVAVLASLFTALQKVHLYNTLPALIITYLIGILPFTIWVMQSFFRGMPRDLEEAAYVDGASPWQTYWRVMLPLALPGLATTGILAVFAAWQEFIFALSFLSSQDKYTVPLAIVNTGQSQASAYQIPWGEQMAETLVVMIPLIIVVLVLQRRIISGLTAGAVKG